MSGSGSAPASGKYIEGLYPELDIADSVSKILHVRLGALDSVLSELKETAPGNSKLMKRLRVTARRAEAAVIALDPCLKRSRSRMVLKRLRQIRRAVGAARDCDVHACMFAEQLASVSEDVESVVIEYLIGRTRASRGDALHEVEEALHDNRGNRFRKRAAKLIGTVRAPKKASVLVELAPIALTKVIQTAVKTSQRDLAELEHLHDLRRKG